MKARKQGQLVVISSLAGKLGVPYRAPYSGSKHAITSLFDSIRAEVIEWFQSFSFCFSSLASK